MKRSLTKNERLRKKRDIRIVYSSGSSFSCKGLKLVKVSNGLDYSRVLFSPGRQCSNAVARNYCKRVGREIVRQLKDRIIPGFDIAFIIYPGSYSYQDRQSQFIQTLTKSHLIENNLFLEK